MADRQSTTDRFWAKVDKNGPVPEHMPHLGQCWIWTGVPDDKGYGQCRMAGARGSHRVAWVLTSGMPPPETPCVLHDCDTPLCVRPSHLHLGTKRLNNEEREARGRTARGDRAGARTHPECLRRGDNHPARLHPERMSRGEKHWRTKITDSDVREIRRRALTETYRAIAADYPLTEGAVSKIARRLMWAHVQ